MLSAHAGRCRTVARALGPIGLKATVPAAPALRSLHVATERVNEGMDVRLPQCRRDGDERSYAPNLAKRRLIVAAPESATRTCRRCSFTREVPKVASRTLRGIPAFRRCYGGLFDLELIRWNI